MMRAVLFLLMLAVGAVGAQYQPGDLLFVVDSQSPGTYLLMRYTPTSNVPSTVVGFPGAPRTILSSPDNRSMLISTWGKTLAVPPNGVVQTVSGTVPGALMELDGAGRLWGSDFGVRTVDFFDFTPAGPARLRTYNVLAWGNPVLEPHSGHAIDTFANRAYTLHGPSVTTTLNLPSFAGANAEWSPELAAMVGKHGDHLAAFTLASPPHVTTLVTNAKPNVIERGPRGTLFSMSLWHNRIDEFDPIQNVTIRSLPLPPRSQPLMAVARGRTLAGLGPATRGSTWPLRISFPGEPGALYMSAIAFSIHRGSPIGNGFRLFLAHDPLLRLSVTNAGLFTGMHGQLDARGEASARVTIPQLPGLAGLRIFAQAIAIRSGLVVGASAPVGVTIP